MHFMQAEEVSGPPLIRSSSSDIVLPRLKCDRAPICKNCEKRPLGSCVYVHSGPTINRKVIDRTANSSSQARSISVQDRIRRLERLVISLAETPRAIEAETWPESEQDATNGESRQRATNDPDNSAQGVAGPFGRLSVDESETRFINPSHWEAILDDVMLSMRINVMLMLIYSRLQKSKMP